MNQGRHEACIGNITVVHDEDIVQITYVEGDFDEQAYLICCRQLGLGGEDWECVFLEDDKDGTTTITFQIVEPA